MVAAGWIQKSKKTHPLHTANTTKDIILEKKWKVLDWPSQSPDINPFEHAFHLLWLKGKTPWNKQQLKEAITIVSGRWKGRTQMHSDESEKRGFNEG